MTDRYTGIIQKANKVFIVSNAYILWEKLFNIIYVGHNMVIMFYVLHSEFYI